MKRSTLDPQIAAVTGSSPSNLTDPLQDEATLERRLLQSDRQILAGRAATAMAHDLNNVLNTISCITDVLLLEQPPNSQSRVELG